MLSNLRLQMAKKLCACIFDIFKLLHEKRMKKIVVSIYFRVFDQA